MDGGGDTLSDARLRMVRQLAEFQKFHVALAVQSSALKKFGNNGEGLAEIRLAYEMLEQYLAQTDAFLENMRGRFDARLGVLRRAEPQLDGRPNRADMAPGHNEFWLEFSRLTAVLRRIARRSEL
ncbi:MAG: hypothetical protein P4L66_12040 [Acetobacteraceae bacterium]|nr:hypothetical protein [Acetobacteraceae bacterium]